MSWGMNQRSQQKRKKLRTLTSSLCVGIITLLNSIPWPTLFLTSALIPYPIGRVILSAILKLSLFWFKLLHQELHGCDQTKLPYSNGCLGRSALREKINLLKGVDRKVETFSCGPYYWSKQWAENARQCGIFLFSGFIVTRDCWQRRNWRLPVHVSEFLPCSKCLACLGAVFPHPWAPVLNVAYQFGLIASFELAVENMANRDQDTAEEFCSRLSRGQWRPIFGSETMWLHKRLQ